MVAVAASSWGSWPFILHHVESFGPVDAVLESLVVMVAITLASAPMVLTDRIKGPAGRRGWLGVGWLGVADSFNVLLLFGAYQMTSVPIAVVTHYLTPLFVALAAPLLLREPGRPRTYVAAAMGFAGLVVMMLGRGAPDRGQNDWLGAALGAGSAVFYASNVIVNKRLAGRFSGSQLMFFHGLVAVPLLAILSCHAEWHIATPAMLWLALGALGPGAAGGLLFVWGLRRIPTSHASTLTLLEPLVAVTMATLTMGQRLRAPVVLGGAVILASALLVMLPHGTSHQK